MARKAIGGALFFTTLWLGLWAGLTSPCCAQSDPAPARRHVRLPPAYAGTPLSTQIHAEAEYLVARGDLAESVAIARRIHADAFAKEIENSVDYVDAYFRRRELNRQWRAKENPDRLQREVNQYDARKQEMKELPEEFLKSDVTSKLNWLLAELSGPTTALRYMANRPTHFGLAGSGVFPPERSGTTDSEQNRTLASAELEMIRFSDGEISFAASDPKLLEQKWPWALRAPDFEEARNRFLSARDRVAEEVRAEGQAEFESGEELVKSLDELLVTLENTYPIEKRREKTASLSYHAARRFLRSMAAETHKILQGKADVILDNAVRFEGGTVVELLQHMDRSGLVFAPPPPGGDRVYRSLLGDMRNLYLTFGS